MISGMLPAKRPPPSRRAGPRPPAGVAAAVLLAALAFLAAGCVRPLAVQSEYFAPGAGTIAKVGAVTRQTVSHHRALQAAQRACTDPEAPAAPPPGPDLAAAPGPDLSVAPGPDLSVAPARDALANVCATTVARKGPVRAHGATSQAYERWVKGQVRELPSPSETAAGAAGG